MKKLILGVLLASCILVSSNFSRGIKAFNNNDYAKAYRLLKKSGSNKINAQIAMAYMLITGQDGVEQDYEKGEYYCRKVIERKKYKLKQTAQQEFCAASMLELGKKYKNEKDYQEAEFWYTHARKLAIKLARKGKKTWQYNMGFFYYAGEGGVEKDMEKAFYWYKKSAMQGYEAAQNMLANMYFYGKGTQKDPEKAFYWYKKSAMQDDEAAQYSLGGLYYHGKGTQKDLEKAFYWYKKSAMQGYAYSQSRIGIMYYNGEGVTQDRERGVRWLKKAAEKNDSFAIKTLKQIKEQNEGYKQKAQQTNPLFEKAKVFYQKNQIKKAFALFKQAAEDGDSISQYAVGLMYINGEGVKKDIDKGRYWIRKSADQGNREAIVFLYALPKAKSAGDANINGGPDASKDNNPLITKANAGDIKSQVELARQYYQGSNGMPKSMEKTLFWLEKAASRGDAMSQNMLGAFYLNGTDGIKEDIDKSLYWHSKAAEQNNRNSQAVLGWLYLYKTRPRDVNKSITYLTKAIEGNPKAEDLHFHRAYAYSLKGNACKAIEDYKKEISISPKKQPAYFNLGVIYALNKDTSISNSKQAIEMAIRADTLSRDKQTLSLLAAAYARDGQYEKAIEFSSMAMDGLNKTDAVYIDESKRLELYKQHKPYIEN